MPAVSVRNLTKHYGRYQALAGVSFDVAEGGLFGFLGPNGAGKSTTIRIVLGLLRAGGGEARVFDRDAWTDGPRVRAEVGYLPGDVRFYDGMTGRQTLDFFRAARRVDCAKEVERLASQFALDLDVRVRAYSRGMKQKLGLIQALMHRPRLLVLDEPTIGLDPLMRETLFSELRAVVADGRTVVFSSHTLSEVEALCDEIAIVRRGKVIEHERVDVLRRRALRRVEVFFDREPDAALAPPKALNVTQRERRTLTGSWTGPVDELITWLAAQPVRDVTIAPPDLEDLFMAYYSPADKGAGA